MKPQPTVIVLAAGRGSRFAGPRHKLVQPLGGASVLGQTISHAIQSGLGVVVVTTEALASEASRWVATHDVVLMPQVGSSAAQRLGVGSSISAGVAARAHAGGWLIVPGDMPLIAPGTLRAVADALSAHPVAYAQYRGRRGHPVGFAAELYSDLIQLSGDEGARRVMARFPSIGVEVDDPGVLLDVDTEADLALVRSAIGSELPASALETRQWETRH